VENSFSSNTSIILFGEKRCIIRWRNKGVFVGFPLFHSASVSTILSTIHYQAANQKLVYNSNFKTEEMIQNKNG
jgi:hypothetical protein